MITIDNEEKTAKVFVEHTDKALEKAFVRWTTFDVVTQQILRAMAGTVGVTVDISELQFSNRSGVYSLDTSILAKFLHTDQTAKSGEDLLYGRTHTFVWNKHLNLDRSKRADDEFFSNDMGDRIRKFSGLEVILNDSNGDQWSKIPLTKDRKTYTFERLSSFNLFWYAMQIGKSDLYSSKEQAGIQYMYDYITTKMTWYLQHNTKVPALLLKSGVFLSNTQLKAFGITFNDSSTDTAEARVKNKDYVFFSLTPSMRLRESRYGYGCIFIKVDENSGLFQESEGGWISLFEQGKPWDDAIEVRFKDNKVGGASFSDAPLFRRGKGSMMRKDIAYCYYSSATPAFVSGYCFHDTTTINNAIDCLKWIMTDLVYKPRETRDAWFAKRMPEDIKKVVKKTPASPWMTFDVGTPTPHHKIMIPSMMQVFGGPDTLSGIALATIFHLIHMGGAIRKYFLDGAPTNVPQYQSNLETLLTYLYRIEVKFPVRYVIQPGSKWWAYFVGNMDDGDNKNVTVINGDHKSGISFKNDLKHMKGDLEIPDYKVTSKIDPRTGKYLPED